MTSEVGVLPRQILTDIADAIREKKGTSELMKPTQMAESILSIQGGDNAARYSVSVTGGYNGGAVITVKIKNTTIFTATASDTYNLVYDKVSGSQTVDGVEYSVTVTPPTNNTAPLGISLSNSEEEKTFSVPYKKVNTSYGYDYSDEGTIHIPSGGGNNILYGVETPTSDIGNDGDLYIKTHSYTKDFTCDPEYLVISTTQRLATHSVAFYKTVEGPAIAVHYYNSDGFYGPLLVSTNPEYVKHTRSTGDPWGSAIIDGTTWYLSKPNYWNQNPDNPTIPTMYDVPEWYYDENAVSGLISEILSRSHAQPSEEESDYKIDEFYLKVKGTWLLASNGSISDVNLSGGVPVFTKEQWDAKTTEEKQAYGIVAVTDGSGYICGSVYDGSKARGITNADYLPYTVADFVSLCRADYDAVGERTWGIGTSPLEFSGIVPTRQPDGSIGVYNYGSYNSGYARVSIGTSFTAYLVGKLITGSYVYGSMAYFWTGRAFLLDAEAENLQLSAWGSKVALPNNVPRYGGYFVSCLRWNGSSGAGTATSVGGSVSSLATCGGRISSYLHISGIQAEASGKEGNRGADLNVLFFAVVNTAEDDNTIIDNVNHLSQKYSSFASSV
jgi:hypothetical protein